MSPPSASSSSSSEQQEASVLGKRSNDQVENSKEEDSSESQSKKATSSSNMEQSLKNHIDSLVKSWYFTPMPPIRPGVGEYTTYECFSYDELPKIEDIYKSEEGDECQFKQPSFDGTWEWKLKSMKEQIEEFKQLRGNEKRKNNKREKFGLTQIDPTYTQSDVDLLPPVLKVLFNDVYFHFLTSDIESPTACYFSLMKPIPLSSYSPKHEFCLVPFFNDQQSCLTWFALFDRKASKEEFNNMPGCFENPIVVTGISIADLEDDDSQVVKLDDLQFQAPSIEEFVWRTAVESNLWMCVHPQCGKMKPIDIKYKPGQRYALHYENLQKAKQSTTQKQDEKKEEETKQ
ncbi:predicted protein [Naegleria gruberi]|uniref:Predicted protein n=1 Tax=Naegleria gruberi TaxID=5762 RepID=D2VUZ5_NAEGR|nr:uncharacterized protein NAEGRDRAFT_52467 [Naegleria gruberi]EFC39405.1 predicted protein [Naegleria gruberi]|eukprot:XP_002672149.1 predicted protein [Naegleria gruberi strain NEG-M]